MKLNTSISFFSSFILLLFSSFLNYSSSSVLSSANIGVMISVRTTRNTPSTNIPYLGAVLMAIDHINNKNDGMYDDILPETTLRIVHSGSNGNKFLQGALIASNLLQVDPTRGIMINIGPIGNYSLQGAIPTFRENGNVPVISFNDRTAVFGNSDFYPNFLRTVPGLYQDGFAIASLLVNYFHWKKVTIFSSSTDSSRASTLVFRHYAAKFGIEILSAHTIDRSRTDMTSLIISAKKAGARIFILFLDPSVGKKVIEQGQELKLFKKGTQIIGGEELSTIKSWTQMKLSPSTINTLLKGYIGVTLSLEIPSNPLKEQFLNNWINHKSTAGYINNQGNSICNKRMDYYNSSYLHQFYPNDNRALAVKCAGINYPSYATHANLEHELDPHMYAYDAAISVALSLHELIYKSKISNPTSADLKEYLLYNLSFTGVTGQIKYSNEMESDHWDIGGRNTEMIYRIVNYVPFDLIANPSLNTSINMTFDTILEWHSENGFPSCDNGHKINETYYVQDNPCHQFIFQSNSVPVDSPNPQLETMPSYFRLILTILSIIGLCFVLIVMIIMFSYHKRKFVKMNQPIVSIFKRVGFLLGFTRILLSSVNTTTNICQVRLWLDHVAFQLIFATLLIQSWRVYLIAGTLKRVKVSDAKSVGFIISSMFMTLLILTIVTVQDQISVKHVTIVQNQFEYTTQPACDYGTRNLIILLYAYDGLILLSGLIVCWMIRNVQSTVSNTSVLVEVILTTATVVIIMFAIIGIYPMSPVTRQIFVSLVIFVLLVRLLWVFEFQQIYHLLAGYELDRGLTLRKTERNILEIMGLSKLSNKILASNQDDITSSMSHDRRSSDPFSPTSKGLEKFAKLKNQEELTAEINRIKDEVRTRQIELACLENMMFASDNASSSRTGRKSNDHRYSYDSGNAMNHHPSGGNGGGESGGEIEFPDIEKPSPLPPSTPQTTTGKLQLSGRKGPGVDMNENEDEHS
mmetsp:Transcript_24202/g.24815  ORF Transcript_24202/g.24815 Transcript_24202/m.24815 type:complete len:974 (+) Transcript_24202:99-3020(+)